MPITRCVKRLCLAFLVTSLGFCPAALGAVTVPALHSAIRRHEGVLRQWQRRRAAEQLALVRSVDPFPTQDRLAGVTRVIAREDAAIRSNRSRLRRIERALRPRVVVPKLLSSSSRSLGADALSIAERYLGVPYRWGGASPASGFDCSGLVSYAYAQLGIGLPHSAAAQYSLLPHVPAAQLEPGDLLFFEPEAGGPGHVGIYAGGGLFVEAPHTGAVVQLTPVASEASRFGFVGAARVS